jgi:hypothetical protein
MGWIVIILVSIVVVAAVAVKLRVSRRGGADISQAQFQERMEQKAGFSNVYHLTGDMAAWRAGLSTQTTGTKAQN